MIANARPRSLFGESGAVVSGHHLATLHAQQCLQEGGSPVDAMVCASAVLAVVLPHASSLGGCGMLLYRDAATGTLHALNGTGRAPLAATGDRFADGMPQRGSRAAVVPTLVRLWARAHERFGRLGWSRLLRPSIHLARHGVPVAEELARNLASADARVLSQPGFAQFMLPRGERLRAAQLLVQPRLADVLTALADEGERAFYLGDAARSLVRFSEQTEGLFKPDDFARARADWVTPLHGQVAGHSVHVMPPNSVGMLMLRQLDEWVRAGSAAGIEDVPRAIMAARSIIDAARGRIGDPSRMPAESGVADADDATGANDATRAKPAPDVGDTTGMVMLDAHGNALAMLQSVFQPFGSGAVDPGTGILLNNRMFDFDHRPGGINSVGPGMRPAHTLNPWLVLREGRVLMAGVSPGGVSQTTTGFQVLSGALSGDACLGELISRARWSLARDGAVMLEPGMPAEVADSLRQQGLSVQADSQHEFYFGSVKVVRRLESGWIEAAADSRRQASAWAW